MPWVIAVPLMIGGSISAHAAGYLVPAHLSRTLAADPDMGSEVAERTSHGLMTMMPLFVGLVVALALAGSCWYLRRSGPGNV